MFRTIFMYCGVQMYKCNVIGCVGGEIQHSTLDEQIVVKVFLPDVPEAELPI